MNDTKERPILFSAPMVKALLEGRKTQTRRVVKGIGGHATATHGDHLSTWDDAFDLGRTLHCPYGKPGDRLWVREGLACKPAVGTIYLADGSPCKAPSVLARSWVRESLPGMFMPRDACRLRLEITDIRVQRVDEISEYDAKAEGALERDSGWSMDWSEVGQLSRFATASRVKGKDAAPLCEADIALGSARSAFLHLFYDVNKRAPTGANPWVWCLTFKVAS